MPKNVVTSKLSIGNHSQKGDFVNIYPNPNNGQMQVNYKIQTDAQMYIYNLMGKQIVQYKLKADSHTINIKQENLPEGVYFYNIETQNDKKYSGKIIIIK